MNNEYRLSASNDNWLFRNFNCKSVSRNLGKHKNSRVVSKHPIVILALWRRADKLAVCSYELSGLLFIINNFDVLFKLGRTIANKKR